MSHKSQMHGSVESYNAVVPAKSSNEGRGGPKEAMEERALTKENGTRADPDRMPGRENGPSGLSRVREAAKKKPNVQFTALLHHVNEDRLRASYYSLKKKAAPGVDGVTWEEYGCGLEERDRRPQGSYPSWRVSSATVARVWIPKADGRQRPLGIAALEDKIVQHAVGSLLNEIWEEDFLGFSYGFRRGVASTLSPCLIVS